ncbi:MAG: Stk1 family PASTA domain-containing Ser/Thr kinase [Oscillospiraceae bacterium]|nr:Stk1 family PASTA domain-containing Ser/Thr kinase [Oscillospiraceae bacterium]
MENSAEKYIGMMLDGRYEIMELIGSGGMAYVYKALCHRLNRYDAIKIMRDETAANEEFRKRFRAESQAVAMLSHPNIVSVYDVSHSDDIEYIVMELVDGITLKQYLQKAGALCPSEVLSFTTQIAKALKHAHNKGIIHRDIKPQNIILLRDGMIKVADFGIASLQSDIEESSGETVGSVHYIAPEQARGAAPDARSDIYSLGIAMYEMLTGRLPYIGNSDTEVAVMHMNTQAAPPRAILPEIPEELERICLKAMDSDIDARYQTAAELLDDLEAFRKQSLAAQVLEDSDSPEAFLIDGDDAPEQPKGGRRSSRRRRKIAFSSGIFAVLIFIILVFVFINGYFLKDLFSEPVRIEVPDFVGRYYEDVINDEDLKKSFKFTITYKVDLDHDKGIILSQDPEGGQSRSVSDKNEKIEVILIISSGEALPDDQRADMFVPNIVNKSRDEAISLIQDAGFTYSISEAPSSSITKGYVINTEPSAGEKAEAGSPVSIIISTGPEVKMTTVPQLKGLSKDAAVAKIEGSNLSVGSVTVVDSELEAGTVVWQSRGAGESVEEHTKIYIQISSGQSGSEG